MKNRNFDPAKLKAERKRRGYSIGKFAIELQRYEPKASKAIVWWWEAGYHQPSGKYLLAISSVFEKKVDYFYK